MQGFGIFCILSLGSMFLALLEIPHCRALAVYIILHAYPKGQYHVNYYRWAYGKAAGINKKQPDVFRRHFQPFSYPLAHTVNIRLNRKLEWINLHGYLLFVSEYNKTISVYAIPTSQVFLARGMWFVTAWQQTQLNSRKVGIHLGGFWKVDTMPILTSWGQVLYKK